MKKLKLKALELGAGQVLTRAQLKNVLGGDEGSGSKWCATDSDCHPITYTCAVSGETYTTGQGDCRYNTFPPHCVYGFVCQP